MAENPYYDPQWDPELVEEDHREDGTCPSCGTSLMESGTFYASWTKCNNCDLEWSIIKKPFEEFNIKTCPKCGSKNTTHGCSMTTTCKDCGFTWYPGYEDQGKNGGDLQLDDIYPWTKDKRRQVDKEDPSKSTKYYEKIGVSIQECTAEWFNEDGSFRSKSDPFWKEKGFDFSGEGPAFVPYREKREELAGEGAQGASGGGGGGCGGGGGACGARAKAEEEKEKSKSILEPCKAVCNAVKGASADPESLLKGLIELAGAVLNIADLLNMLIKPEMLSEMQKQIDSSKELMAKSAESCPGKGKTCCGGCKGGCNKSCSGCKSSCSKIVEKESEKVQADVYAAITAMELAVSIAMDEMESTVIDICNKLAEKAGNENAGVTDQVKAYKEARTKSAEAFLIAQTATTLAIDTATAFVNNPSLEVTPVERTALLSAIKTARDTCGDAITSARETMDQLLDSEVVLGVK